MPRPRTWRPPLLALLLLITLLAVVALLGAERLLNRQGIQINTWQGLHINLNGIALEQLSLSHPDWQLELAQLQLPWRGLSLSLPLWQQVAIQRLHFSLSANPATQPSDAAPAPWQLQQVAGLLALLPQRLQLDDLRVQIPCPQGQCSVQGALLLQASKSREQLSLHFKQAPEALDWQLQLQAQASRVEAQLELRSQQQVQVALQSSAEQLAEHIQWQGQFSANLQHSENLHQLLMQWLPANAATVRSPDSGQIKADWQLQLPGQQLDAAQFSQATGSLTASAYFNQPWPLPGIGQVQGQLALAVHTQAGNWLADSLLADVQLSAIAPELWPQVPASLRPNSLQLRLEPIPLATPVAGQLSSSFSQRALPLKLQLQAHGPSQAQLNAELLLAKQAPWAIQLSHGQLSAKTAATRINNLDIGALSARLNLDAYLDQQQFSLALNKGTSLSAKHLAQDQLRAEQISLSSDQLALKVDLADGAIRDWRSTGQLQLSAQPRHEQLVNQQWRWQGQLIANPKQQQLSGALSNAAGLHLQVDGQHNAQGWQAQAKLEEIFLRSGNPLSQSFSAWPALLELNNGRLNADASLTLAPQASLPNIQLQLRSQGLSGIYDRTELSGLDGKALLSTDAKQLQLQLNDLHLAQANPGIALGPLRLNARYSAALQQPANGQLVLQQASSALLGGQLMVPAGTWSLAAMPLTIPLQIEGLQLQELFKAYPSEGLAGSGSIDGNLPLQLDSAGLSVSNGQLQARAPGGQLQFRSEKIRALGRSNPAMQLVTQSLDDFRFSTLSSTVNYAAQGQLNLGITLQGQNPAIEGGRPIHFSINLQEDIPTLLASLQLSAKVSDTIQQRVQQRMLQRHSQPSAPPSVSTAP
ncbi:YdbH domain-containing protein [Pseudomonas sp. 5P_3.1_Bac2]|uniref:YdbH domain-containing protein n=1 Tax=Pseudomonas sp. 5P_3.1_Bac2 TaxID=2971617 RepID=UPI0021C71238|nr:YdbH domain-containing protein [Pseudomonas sp. 5P_3.1_Bac2]MCU1716861.1 YdbH domain-containing protein [Pseudomonas sp. 5P_3.1_Bac2]